MINKKIYLYEVYEILNKYYKRLFENDKPIMDKNITRCIKEWMYLNCKELNECKTCPLGYKQQWISDLKNIPYDDLCGIIDKMIGQENKEFKRRINAKRRTE